MIAMNADENSSSVMRDNGFVQATYYFIQLEDTEWDLLMASVACRVASTAVGVKSTEGIVSKLTRKLKYEHAAFMHV